MASILFIRWTNGVPTVDPGFSAYFKVPRTGGINVPFCSVSCYPIPETTIIAHMTNADSRRLLSQWGLAELRPEDVTNVVQWNVNLGLGSTGSRWFLMPPYHQIEFELPRSVRPDYQLAIRLVEFERPEGEGSQGQSGVELRFFLEHLWPSPIVTLPNEINQTNYIAGRGLARPLEHWLDRMKFLPMEP